MNSGLHTRRGLLQAASTLSMGLMTAKALTSASAASAAETLSSPLQSLSLSDPELTTADILVETLIRWDGNPTYGCDLAPIDFAAFAKACGADGFKCSHPGEVAAAIRATLHSPRAAVLEALVDANEKPTLPSELKA